MLSAPYEFVRRLPQGGLGEVLVLRDRNGIEFVGKLPKDGTESSQRLIDDEERRFVRHQSEHVVAYLGRIQHADGRIGFAMELMDGSLAELVAARGPLGEREAIEFFTRAVAGMHEVHSSAPGAFHGDLKLANILHKAGRAKLADFGLARGGVGQTRMFGPHEGGTEGYMPPEGYASSAGDVYSLGVVLWAMLAGREPPRLGGLPPVSVRSSSVAALINAMIKASPGERPTMSQVIERLARVREELGLPDANGWFGDFLKAALGVAAVVGAVGLVVGLLSER